MQGRHTKISTDLSGLEGRFAAREEGGGVLSGETESLLELEERNSRDRRIAHLRLLWEHRRLLGHVTGFAILFSTAIAFLIPNRYQSSARLMPPDNQSGSGIAAAAMALAGGSGGGGGLGGLGGLGGVASQLLGQKSTSDLLVGVLTSRTVADDLIQKFNLKTVYRDRRMEDARKDLANRTDTAVDRKSQIITITVTDKDPSRAKAMAQMYVEELDRRLAEVSTSAARRERIFLASRLQDVDQDLEAAEKEFSQFASHNATLDIKEEGKAIVEAGAALQGQLIAARSELEGFGKSMPIAMCGCAPSRLALGNWKPNSARSAVKMKTIRCAPSRIPKMHSIPRFAGCLCSALLTLTSTARRGSRKLYSRC